MRLDVKRSYAVPKDLADQYDDKIAEINLWLEEQMIARGIQPAVFRFIRREENEMGVKARDK